MRSKDPPPPQHTQQVTVPELCILHFHVVLMGPAPVSITRVPFWKEMASELEVGLSSAECPRLSLPLFLSLMCIHRGSR